MKKKLSIISLKTFLTLKQQLPLANKQASKKPSKSYNIALRLIFLVLIYSKLFTELEKNTTKKFPTINLKHPNDSPTHEDLSLFDKTANEQSDGNLSDDQQNEIG